MRNLVIGAIFVGAAAILLGAGCLVDNNPPPNACSMTTENTCPVLPIIDGQCSSVLAAMSGFKTSTQYSQKCQYQAQIRGADNMCKPTDPPVIHSWTANTCKTASGDPCKKH